MRTLRETGTILSESHEADGTHVVVEALCEENAVLQVICVATGEVVYEVVLEDDGTLLDVAGQIFQ